VGHIRLNGGVSYLPRCLIFFAVLISGIQSFVWKYLFGRCFLLCRGAAASAEGHGGAVWSENRVKWAGGYPTICWYRVMLQKGNERG